ncbi:MAG: hypothetical protein ACTSU2_14480 [Promethearchaeota archaeon]
MSFKDLYSEVKARKMAALGKQDIVKAVEKHGKILAISGKYEKPQKIIKYIYASVKEVIKPFEVPKKNLSLYDVVLVGCPGSEIPKSALRQFREYVLDDGGWLLTTDWALRTIVENVFPGYIRWAGEKTDDAVVQCEIVDPHHPFLDGVLTELTSGKYAKKGPKAYSTKSKPTFEWWLEDRSFPITVDRPDLVHVLIKSDEIGRKWGKNPVLVYFDVGKKGGRVIHMISHTHLQKGTGKGKFVSAMIITNILDEKISIKFGLKKKGASPQYIDYGATSGSAIDWGGSGSTNVNTGYTTPTANNSSYITPSTTDFSGAGADYNQGGDDGTTPELVGTAKLIEVKEKPPATQKCALGDGNFEGYTGKIYRCSGCGAYYHEECMNIQLREGICKICERIFLF